MSLINCPDCGARVSTKADRCRACGCPIANPDKSIAISITDTTKLDENILLYPRVCILHPKGNAEDGLTSAQPFDGDTWCYSFIRYNMANILVEYEGQTLQLLRRPAKDIC